MDSFPIPDTTGAGGLEFFERCPADPGLPIERYLVRLTGPDLSALARVYAGDANEHPAPLFARMAAHWRGWPGEITWDSPEGELILRCTQDRAGHVGLRAELRPGATSEDWLARAAVAAEAGQLEGLARRAAAFFGPSA